MLNKKLNILLYSKKKSTIFAEKLVWNKLTMLDDENINQLVKNPVLKRIIAHLSIPWSIGWVALSFLVRLWSRYGNIQPNLQIFQYIQA